MQVWNGLQGGFKTIGRFMCSSYSYPTPQTASYIHFCRFVIPTGASCRKHKASYRTEFLKKKPSGVKEMSEMMEKSVEEII